MMDLKYSELLKLNKELGVKNQLDSYNILLLSNVIVHQGKEVIEYSLRVEGINAIVELGDYDNILQESKKQRNIDATVIFWELANLTNGLHFKAELLNDLQVEELENKVKAEISLALANLKDCPLVVFNKFSSLLVSSLCISRSNFDTLANRLNIFLESLEQKNLRLVDFNKVVSHIGAEISYDLRYFYSSQAPYTITLFKYYSQYIKPFFLSANGKSKKVIIFDCDNTLWDGILDEDGFNNIEMSTDTRNGKIFLEVQTIALNLSKRGIIVGLCSKNNSDAVDEVLTSHQDMILKDSCITIKKINWLDKATNLQQISKELNIGLDSFVFIDDSPFETNLIKELLPEVTVLEVPKKLYNYPTMLRNNLGLFYSLSQTKEDLEKTQMYKQQKKREVKRLEFHSLDDYLSSLGIRIISHQNDSLLISRMAQLSQKVNQFNLTTKRYTERDIQKMVDSPKMIVYAFTVDDKFGSSGVSGLCIINLKSQSAEIDSFLMSCRIIGRNIEYVIMDHIISQLKILGVQSIISQFIPTPKNTQVSEFFDLCNFDFISHKDSIKDYFLLMKNHAPSQIDYIEVIDNE
jgi:FkbH-like protein